MTESGLSLGTVNPKMCLCAFYLRVQDMEILMTRVAVTTARNKNEPRPEHRLKSNDKYPQRYFI
jgi:hypothetical protein